MFIAIVEGAYRHNILGLYSTMEQAIARGKHFVEHMETVGYYTVDISSVEIDQDIDDAPVLATVSRVGYSYNLYWSEGVMKKEVTSPGEVKVEFKIGASPLIDGLCR